MASALPASAAPARGRRRRVARVPRLQLEGLGRREATAASFRARAASAARAASLASRDATLYSASASPRAAASCATAGSSTRSSTSKPVRARREPQYRRVARPAQHADAVPEVVAMTKRVAHVQ